MKAMTAYAYVQKSSGREKVEIVAKSLNSRYLDLVVYRLPPEKIILEQKIRTLLEGKFFRGRIEFHVFAKAEQGQKAFINKELLYTYFYEIKKLSKGLKTENHIGITDILSLPGLISLENRGTIKDNLVLSAVKDAINKIEKFRIKEGQALKRKITGHVRSLSGLIKKINLLKPKAKEGEISREDIDEELALIEFYLKKIEKVLNLKKNGPKGKMIDYLTQEIFKELNTCASKTRKPKLAELVVEAKNYSERVREQAQNIE